MAKRLKLNGTGNLTSEELKILAKCAKDIFYFFTFLWVINPVHGRVQFNLYPYQRSVLYQFLKERFNIILKFRQAGITELISGYCLWLCLFHPNKKINIISIKDTVAKKVLKKIKFMYKNLPWYLQTPIINGRTGEYGSAATMEFVNGSIIDSIPTSENAGRSESLSLLVIDEAAMVRWASTIWASAFPTLSTGGSAIVNSCITGDTEIIGRNGNFRVEQVCPKDFGVQDVSFMNLEVLTHKLQWKKVLYGVNKGILETWEVKNSFGETIKCTPAHKFLTVRGWKPLDEILSKNLTVIRFESGLSKLHDLPVTNPPQVEIRKPIKGFPNYLISNLGKIYTKEGIEKRFMTQKRGDHSSIRVKLWEGGESKNFTLSNLVAEYFIGPIPVGYVVDHINCNPIDNYVTNLQIITFKENTQRATKYSRGLALNTCTGKGASDMHLVGYVKYLYFEKGWCIRDIAERVSKKFDRPIDRKYVGRIVNLQRNLNISCTKLTLIRKFSDNIYDITVEGDESYITTSNYVSHNTPSGIGGFYHQTWVDAIVGGNPFNPLRLYWQMHPDRDERWYKEMASALGPKRTAQEVDGDFLSSGSTVFDLTDIKAIEDMLSEYPPLLTRYNSQYREFSKPEKDKDYYIGADVATGKAYDYSAFSCMDHGGEDQACYKGRIPVDKFAKLLGDTGLYYNNALLAPETNDVGLAVTSWLQTEGYPNLYYYQKVLKGKKDRNGKPKVEEYPGWLTTLKNRSLIIESLEKDVREDIVTIKDPFFVNEAYTFIYDSMGRPIAKGKRRSTNDAEMDFDETTYSDDSIFAKAITNHIRKNHKKRTLVLPQ